MATKYQEIIDEFGNITTDQCEAYKHDGSRCPRKKFDGMDYCRKHTEGEEKDWSLQWNTCQWADGPNDCKRDATEPGPNGEFCSQHLTQYLRERRGV